MSSEHLHIDASRMLGELALDVKAQAPLDGVTAIFGPSGAGKSALLRMIAGFETPSGGRIGLGGEVLFDSTANINIPAWRRPVGYMFQDVRLFPHLTVAGNLAYADKRSGAGAYNLQAVVEALDLQPLLARRPDSLSGGEAQRAALGRTLLTRPKLLLLDEPLSGLDRDRKRDIIPYLRDAVKSFRLPVLLVTHDVDEVVQLADRMVVINKGRVLASGEVQAVLEQDDLQSLTGPLEAGVILSGRLTEIDQRLRLAHIAVADGGVVLPLNRDMSVGDHLRLRVLARDVAIALSKPERLSIRNALRGRIAAISTADDSAYADILIDLGETRLRSQITRASVEELGLQPGADIYALIKSVSVEAAYR